MIENLSIAKIASYSDEPECMIGLKELNFIFGSNGTGKTTIGRLISNSQDFPSCTVSWKNDIQMETLVYNREFIDNNFKPAEVLKGVFTLGEQDIDTVNAIDRLNKERDTLVNKIRGWNVNLHGEDDKNGKFKELSVLDEEFRDLCWKVKSAHDSKFSGAFGGVRGSTEKFKSRVLENVDNTSALQLKDELDRRALTIFGDSPIFEQQVTSIDSTAIVAHQADPILNKTVIGKNDVDIAAMILKLGNSDWVKEGRAYFEHNNNDCPFCQQATKEIFSHSLNKYFDEAFELDIKAIDILETNYDNDAKSLLQTLDSIIAAPCRFLDVDKLKVERELLNSKVTINQQRISAKRKETSRSIKLESLESVLSEINRLIATANTSIAEHNLLVDNLTSEKLMLTSQIWRFIVEEIKTEIDTYTLKRRNLEKAIKALEDQVAEAIKLKAKKSEEIRYLESKTTSIQPTVDEINKLLRSFGFHGFFIAHVPGTKSYKLVREDGGEAMRTMSEGEKTFVTFLYFFQLIKGSESESGKINDRVVVFDDPVSSLDSDILFIVGSLIKGLFEEIREKKGHIKQVFVLTHNVYFHKEVTFNQPDRKRKHINDVTFWIVRKHDFRSKLVPYLTNPIKTSYELLWDELRRPELSNLTLQNTIRRILENYFKILGAVNFESICDSFEGKERFVCKSFFSWAHDGSHFAHDDLFIADGATAEIYLKVFKAIFVTLDHGGHYRMMMKEDDG